VGQSKQPGASLILEQLRVPYVGADVGIRAEHRTARDVPGSETGSRRGLEQAAMTDRPRTFAEMVAVEDPAERTYGTRRDVQASVANEFHAEVSVHEDRYGNGEWRVEYFDDDGGCYVTIFAGPESEPRARDYFRAMKSGSSKIVRAGTSAH
jgi:hypothetical protein